MNEYSNEKHYDLEDRTAEYAGDVAIFCNQLPKTPSNIEHGKQAIRSSGSIAANYIEANEALSRKDFIYRLKICRKESKETALWFRLMRKTNASDYVESINKFYNESIELKKIFSAIINKSEEK